MSKNQKIAFWSGFVSFCVVGSIMIGIQGAFDNLHIGGGFILVFFYLVCAFFIYQYIKKNPEEVESWFEE